jgi:hypothetical protein
MILTMYFKGLQPCWVVTPQGEQLTYEQEKFQLFYAISDMERYWHHENDAQPSSICLSYAGYRFELEYDYTTEEGEKYDQEDWHRLHHAIRVCKGSSRQRTVR